ncbi:hypothetical protein CGC20_8470 [Leishmania donovani]|uniref:Uncharacterized protein n=1 Tax=Leishmania donovani TaxID=5661 RepID=A0A504X730_LEIDO|nr:hypothetical protein CGC20_8470 [Leishmania donovani]
MSKTISDTLHAGQIATTLTGAHSLLFACRQTDRLTYSRSDAYRQLLPDRFTDLAGILFREYDGKELRGNDLVAGHLSMDARTGNVFYAVADHRVVGISVSIRVHSVLQRLDYWPNKAKSLEGTRNALELFHASAGGSQSQPVPSVKIGLHLEELQCGMCLVDDVCVFALPVRKR